MKHRNCFYCGRMLEVTQFCECDPHLDSREFYWYESPKQKKSNNMKTPITPEALIKMGFKKNKMFHSLAITNNMKIVYVNDFNTNATTIEDIEYLIRLFK